MLERDRSPADVAHFPAIDGSGKVAAARALSPAPEPREPSPPSPEPAKPKPVAKPRKPPERKDVKAYRKALAAFEAEQTMISRHVSLGHLKHDHARAVALGAATMVPIMLLMRRWFL